MKDDTYYRELLDELLEVDSGLFDDEVEFIDSITSWADGDMSFIPSDAEKIERIHTRRFK